MQPPVRCRRVSLLPPSFLALLLLACLNAVLFGPAAPQIAAAAPAAGGAPSAGSRNTPFPRSAWPADDPALVHLGRLLFHDRALSIDGSLACADCHQQALAFTDGRRVARGATGAAHTRNTPGLANTAWMASLGWSDPLLWRLEEQHRIPLFGVAPLEMGLVEPLPATLVARLTEHPRYRTAFAAVAARARRASNGAHPDMRAVQPDADGIVRALAAFVRSLVSCSSPFDAWLYGDGRDALSADARAGFRLFTSARLGCGDCHGGFLIGGAVRTHALQQAPSILRNGVAWNADDPGLGLHTGRREDDGRFRVPSLRNVALTAPYMHDGSLATLEEVLDHYELDHRELGPPRAGDAQQAHGVQPALADHGVRSSSGLRRFALDADERRQLLAFLAALTDAQFVQDAAFANPW